MPCISVGCSKHHYINKLFEEKTELRKHSLRSGYTHTHTHTRTHAINWPQCDCVSISISCRGNIIYSDHHTSNTARHQQQKAYFMIRGLRLVFHHSKYKFQLVCAPFWVCSHFRILSSVKNGLQSKLWLRTKNLKIHSESVLIKAVM